MHNVEPDLDIPFGRGVTPLGKQVNGMSSNSFHRTETPTGGISRGVTPNGAGAEPRLSMVRGSTPSEGVSSEPRLSLRVLTPSEGGNSEPRLSLRCLTPSEGSRIVEEGEH
mmetsp:Transcript_86953/g.202429  ORF Transcript_86953/g.202429 Transcript_86953/m.202429 type:complete len:111 (+) Transcript_86953:3-335(+)